MRRVCERGFVGKVYRARRTGVQEEKQSPHRCSAPTSRCEHAKKKRSNQSITGWGDRGFQETLWSVPRLRTYFARAARARDRVSSLVKRSGSRGCENDRWRRSERGGRGSSISSFRPALFWWAISPSLMAALLDCVTNERPARMLWSFLTHRHQDSHPLFA